MLCGLAVSVGAQNPGYQGNRFSLFYDFYTMNALRFPNESGYNGFSSFNTKHAVNLDIATGRHICLGVALEYLRTSFPYNDGLRYTRPAYTGDYTNYTFISHDCGKIETYITGIYLKRFFTGNLAPLGTYIKPQISLMTYKVYPGNPLDRNGNSLSDLGIKLTNNSPYYSLAISLEIGQTRIFFNRMFIDYGVRVGIMPGAREFLSGLPDLMAYNYLDEIPKMRLSTHYLLDVKAGVGVLLF